VFPYTPSELNAVLFQALVTAGLAALCAFLFVRYRKPWFLWWAVAWAVFVLRIGAIVGFLVTTRDDFLFLHQVLSGWTALILLAAAVEFSHRFRWHSWYVLLLLFPPVWSFIAIYRLDTFLLAAIPAVLFLSVATFWTAWVFLRFARQADSWGAAMLTAVFGLWGLHHLDYPLLRARGAWNPWGYYLDILFVLATGVGMLLLVIEDLQRGLASLTAFAGELQPTPARQGDGAVSPASHAHSGPTPAREGDGDGTVAVDALLARPLELPGTRGSALFMLSDGHGRFVRGLGDGASWIDGDASGSAWSHLALAIESGRPVVAHEWRDPVSSRVYAYAAALPLSRDDRRRGALVFVGDARDPFTALGDEFLEALGRQVGTALERAELLSRLETHARELERMATRMVQQHEEERRRISLELHDETAQVFAALKLQLGVLREQVDASLGERVDRVLALVDSGMRSIRSVTRDLRPPLLDDLGLEGALHAMVTSFAERTALAVRFDAPETVPPVSPEAELALFRALQEALSNVARHAGAHRVVVTLDADGDGLSLTVRDDGRGLDAAEPSNRLRQPMGLTGMRERLLALGGNLRVEPADGGGLLLRARLPWSPSAPSTVEDDA
jgi:signal transduction histidine kinase